MARQSGWARFGIAMAILIALALGVPAMVAAILFLTGHR